MTDPTRTPPMQDAVLIDLAVKVEPSIEVVFIDTGYHFPETLDTVEVPPGSIVPGTAETETSDGIRTTTRALRAGRRRGVPRKASR